MPTRQRIQRINHSQRMQIGAVDNRLAASEVALNLIPPVVAHIMDGISGLRQGQAQSDHHEGKGEIVHRVIELIRSNI